MTTNICRKNRCTKDVLAKYKRFSRQIDRDEDYDNTVRKGGDMKQKTKKITLVAVLFTLLLTGCAIGVAPTKQMFWHARVIDPAKHDYTILGPVRVEREWTGILGTSFSAPLIGLNIENYLFSYGGINYVDVLEEALRRYPGTDTVIDITYDYQKNKFLFLYASRTEIITGMAIRYNREQKNTWNRAVND